MILGIDPGFSGALAWYCPKSHRLVGLMPMPTRKGSESSLLSSGVGNAKSETRREIDGKALAKVIFAQSPQLVVLERVNASPQMGVTSAFRFGEGFGVICGVLGAMGQEPRMIYPAAWKSALGLGRDKSESIVLASKLFPEWESHFRKGAKSADLAEAALLAYYGLRLRNFSSI